MTFYLTIKQDDQFIMHLFVMGCGSKREWLAKKHGNVHLVLDYKAELSLSLFGLRVNNILDEKNSSRITGSRWE